MNAGVVTRRRDGVEVLGVGEWTTRATFEVAVASKSAAARSRKPAVASKRCAKRLHPQPPER